MLVDSETSSAPNARTSAADLDWAVDDEVLLGNAYTGDTTPPQATIGVKIAGKGQTLRVDLTRPGPSVLSSVSVFDGSCATVYTTHETVAFTPAALGIFDRLAAAQTALQTRVSGRHLFSHCRF